MYSGQQADIPVAQGGLLTDLAPAKIPPENLITATNVILRSGVLEKAFGSQKFNQTALPSPIVAAFDYWPDDGTQRLIVVTKAGRVYRITDPYTTEEIVPADSTAPTTLTVSERVHIVQGGQEYLSNTAGTKTNHRKLFIFTGNDQIQVIEGDGLTRRNIMTPATDWDGTTGKTSYPFFGIIYLNRLVVFGNTNLPHYVYVSSDQISATLNGHEDFSSTSFNSAFFNVYPGEGTRLQSAFEFKNKLHFLKYPFGLYQMQIQDVSDPTTWYITKLNGDVGASSVYAAASVIDDVWVMNSSGTIQSLAATLNLGGIETANVLRMMYVQKYIQQITSPLGYGERQAFWHDLKNTAYFSFRGKDAQSNNVILAFDFTEQKPKLSVYTHLQANIIAARRNINQLNEVIIGSDDGFVYICDQATRTSAGSAYTGEFQTPHTEFGTSQDKNFDFVEVEYIPTGNVDLDMSWYIEGNLQGTKTFNLGKSNQLDHFVLDQNKLQGRATRNQRLPIYGRGRSLSLKFSNDQNQNFKITAITVSMRLSGEDDKP